MIVQSLPTKLNKEPLVDAVFEIRFSSSTTASSILPGFFFAKLQPKEWRIEHLPFAEFPSQMRNSDPNLRYRPLIRIHWDEFIILIGDTILGVACKMPYPGWIRFKERILEVVKLLEEVNIVQTIERYSLKYADIVDGENLLQQIQRVNITLQVGSHTLKEENFTIRIEIPYDNFLNVVQIAATATAKIVNTPIRKGVLVEIDTLCNYETSDFNRFIIELSDRLDAIHMENKKKFFDCLKPETINYLEPVYE